MEKILIPALILGSLFLASRKPKGETSITFDPDSTADSTPVGVGRIDEYAVNELILFADNDYKLYTVLQDTYFENLERKVKRGTYDPEKAVKLFHYYYNNYVRPEYKRQLGSDIKLNPKERNLFGQYYVEQFEDERL